MANLAVGKTHSGVISWLFKANLMISSVKFCWNKN